MSTNTDGWNILSLECFLKRNATENEKQVLSAIMESGDTGRTCEEVEQRIGLRHQTVSATLTHLAKIGYVKSVLRGDKTTSGSRAGTWVLTERPGVRENPPTSTEMMLYRAYTTLRKHMTSDEAKDAALYITKGKKSLKMSAKAKDQEFQSLLAALRAGKEAVAT